MRAEGVEQQCAGRGEQLGGRVEEELEQRLGLRGRQLGVRVRDAREQPRRAFNVAEEQGDRAGRKLGHGPSTMAATPGYVRLIVIRSSSSSGQSRIARIAATTACTPCTCWK